MATNVTNQATTPTTASPCPICWTSGGLSVRPSSMLATAYMLSGKTMLHIDGTCASSTRGMTCRQTRKAISHGTARSRTPTQDDGQAGQCGPGDHHRG